MNILRHVWTVFLLSFGGVFLVLLPYKAIVESDLIFWPVVVSGLLVSFVCAASETAFALACGEDERSPIYAANERRKKAAQKIYESNRAYITPQLRNYALRRAKRLDTLMNISLNYKGIYNPRLVVTNNVAIIIVTVLSGLAQFTTPKTHLAHSDCVWLSKFLPGFSESFRCIDAGGHFIPFPVNMDAFQSAFALTLILIVGEIIPKQIASAFPAQVAEMFLRPLSLVSVLSLGTGPSFGVAGQQLEKLIKTLLKPRRTAQNLGAVRRTAADIVQTGDSSYSLSSAVALCDGDNPLLGHPRVFLCQGKE